MNTALRVTAILLCMAGAFCSPLHAELIRVQFSGVLTVEDSGPLGGGSTLDPGANPFGFVEGTRFLGEWYYNSDGAPSSTFEGGSTFIARETNYTAVWSELGPQEGTTAGGFIGYVYDHPTYSDEFYYRVENAIIPIRNDGLPPSSFNMFGTLRLRDSTGAVFSGPRLPTSFELGDFDSAIFYLADPAFGGKVTSLSAAAVGTPIPEPTTLALLGMGAAGLFVVRRRRKNAA